MRRELISLALRLNLPMIHSTRKTRNGQDQVKIKKTAIQINRIITPKSSLSLYKVTYFSSIILFEACKIQGR